MSAPDAVGGRAGAGRRLLLLRAVLLPAPAGPDAWRVWRPRARLDALSPEESRLLPLVVRALPPGGLAADPDASRLRGCARQAWARGEALAGALGRAAGALAGAGIESLLVRGLAAAWSAYPDPAARASANLDLLVPGERLAAADAALRGSGWDAPLRLTPGLAAQASSLALRDRSGLVLRLHWHLLAERPDAALDAAARASVREAAAGGRRATVPDATVQLLHLCARAAVSARAHRLQWAADAWHLLAAPGDPVDFGRLERLAIAHRLVPPVRDALRFLVAALGAPVPAGTLERLEGVAVDPAEERARRWSARLDPAIGPLPWLWRAWRERRRRDATPAAGFPSFLLHSLGLARARDLPPLLARAARRRLAPPR